MKRFYVALILFSLLLSSCGTFEIYVETTPEENSAISAEAVATAEPQLSLNSTSDEIQLAMLESATKWKSIWMDGTVTNYAMSQTDSQPTTNREQVWIDLTTSRFRVVMGPVDGEAETFKSSDGISILEMDLQSGQSQSYPMAPLPEEKQYVPTRQPGYAYPQPLWGQIGTPLSQLAFSSDFAQNEGTFKPSGIKKIADRDALVVEWTSAQNALPSFRMWLDVKTAVILKMQSFDKEGGEMVRSEVVVNRVSFNDVFANSLFETPASLPRFSDIAGHPLNAGEPAPTASSDPDPLKDVYFFVSDHNYGNEKLQLMRLPGSCVAGLVACPEAQGITGPSDLKFFTPMIWSPNGEEAALAYPITEEGNSAGLFLFDAQEQTWNALANFNYIDPPMWSPDGKWLAFRVQDGQGLDEIHAIRRDGSGSTNLSGSEKLPSEGQPYILNGWINNNVILRGTNNMVYLMRVDDGMVKPLFDTPWAKSNFVPSPDGYFLAYADFTEERSVLKLLTPDGNTTRNLITFERSTISPLVWSPDGTHLAFTKLTNETGLAMVQDMYTIAIDGQDLQQVYHSNTASITDLIFSPDGRYLLFQDDDATGRHLFVVDRSTLEKHRVQIPNLPLDWWTLAPSWRR